MTMPVPAESKPQRFVMKDSAGNVVGRGEFRKVPVSDIKIDSSYQRDVSSAWVHAHGPFDPRRADAIVLSSRQGGPYCIDGGHRLALARESGEHYINSFVIDGLSKADEAKLFTQYQRDRRNLTSYALFRADVVAGDEETLSIVRIVNNAGFHLAKTTGSLNITAIDAVRWVHRYGGDDLLIRTLELIRRMWFEEKKSLSGQIIKGLGMFLASAGEQPTFSADRLHRVMDKHSPSKLLRLAQEIASRRNAVTGNSPSNVAEAIQAEYDKLRAKDEPPLQPLVINRRRRPAPYNSTAR